MKTVTFTVPGPPPGKPRMTRQDKWKKRDRVMRWRAWADETRLRARQAFRGNLPTADRVHRVSWVAYFRPPASWSKKRQEEAIGEIHRQKPDRDNIDKGLLDALFEEDAGIGPGCIDKRWDWEPRLEVIVDYH